MKRIALVLAALLAAPLLASGLDDSSSALRLIDAPIMSGSSLQKSTRPLALVDAGPEPDAGPSDAGPPPEPDAGPPDAGPADAGPPAPTLADPLIYYRVSDLGLSDTAPISSFPSTGSRTGAALSQATSDARPSVVASCLNSLACADFDGDDFLDSEGFTAIEQPFTLCAVAGVTTSAAGVRTIQAGPGSSGSAARLWTDSTSWRALVQSSAQISRAATVNANQFRIVCFYADGASSALTTDGTSSTGTQTGSFAAVRLGRTWSTGSGYLTGRIVEIGAWSGDVRTAFRDAAQARYGTLPATW